MQVSRVKNVSSSSTTYWPSFEKKTLLCTSNGKEIEFKDKLQRFTARIQDVMSSFDFDDDDDNASDTQLPQLGELSSLQSSLSDTDDDNETDDDDDDMLLKNATTYKHKSNATTCIAVNSLFMPSTEHEINKATSQTMMMTGNKRRRRDDDYGEDEVLSTTSSLMMNIELSSSLSSSSSSMPEEEQDNSKHVSSQASPRPLMRRSSLKRIRTFDHLSSLSSSSSSLSSVFSDTNKNHQYHITIKRASIA